MIKSVAEGKMEISAQFAEEMSFCLDCQACETACPAGVQYGKMVEGARVAISKTAYGKTIPQLIKKVGLNYILASKTNLKIAARLLWLYQRLGIQKLLHKLAIFEIFMPKIGRADDLAPTISCTFSESSFQENMTPPKGKKHKVAFLTGCLMDVAFADINRDTVEVLLANGCEVFIPKGQVCCGSLHAHNGEKDKAVELAKKNLDAFATQDYDYLISNSAGCGAFMKHYNELFAEEPEYQKKAEHFSHKVKDITEFLAEIDLNVEDMGVLNVKATYHDACHLSHAQKVTSQPRKVLAAIPGLELVPLDESLWCCGSAGIYNVMRYDDSMKFLEKKMTNIKKTKAEMVITSNPGCLGQIQYGAKLEGLDIEVVHPATVLHRAYLEKSDKN